jgi:hypothetical protein
MCASSNTNLLNNPNDRDTSQPFCRLYRLTVTDAAERIKEPLQQRFKAYQQQWQLPCREVDLP